MGTAPRIRPPWMTTAALNSPPSAWTGAPTTITGRSASLARDDLVKRAVAGVEQRALMKQVLAGVAGQPELGEDHQRGVSASARWASSTVRAALNRGSPTRTCGTAAATRTNPWA